VAKRSEICDINNRRHNQIRQKCSKFDFGWGSARYPAGGAYSAPPSPPPVGLGDLLPISGRTVEGKAEEGKGG